MRPIQAQWPMPTTGLVDKIGSDVAAEDAARKSFERLPEPKEQQPRFPKISLALPRMPSDHYVDR
jgi:hypothetical protein